MDHSKIPSDSPVRVVSILGAQSSGKSTLLNLLFGTNFGTMTASTGPSQTTKGIWLAKARKLDGVLVMDVEGTDSSERGSTALDYERKSSLFSLALSEIVVVNLWSHDVGRSNAANLPLLKMVFEVNLQVFQEVDAPKTILLFVIRDHVTTTTALEVLAKRILKDMHEIWNSIPKPTHWQNASVTDVFEFSFNSLAHFVLEPDNFERDCQELSNRFFHANNESYLFRRSHPKTIPADGFAQYATGIWDTILENRNLDLPSQKQILSLHRCSDFLQQSYNLFLDDERVLMANADAGNIIQNFEGECTRLIKRSFGLYDVVTDGYHPEVRASKGSELRKKIFHDLSVLLDFQLRNVSRAMLDRFARAYDNITVDGDTDMKAAVAEAKEAGLALLPNVQRLDPDQIDPDVIKMCAGPYGDMRRTFLADVEEKCNKMMLDQADARNAELRAKLDRVRGEYESQVARLQDENNMLESQLASDRQSFDIKMKATSWKLTSVQESNEHLEKENGTMRERMDAQREEIEELKHKVATGTEEHQSKVRQLKTSNDALKSENQELSTELKVLRDETSARQRVVEAETAALKDEMVQNNRRVSEYEMKCHNMETSTREAVARAAELEEKMRIITNTITGQAEAITVLRSERERAIDQLSREKEVLQQQHEDDQARIGQYERIVGQHEEEMNSVRQQLAQAASTTVSSNAEVNEDMDNLRRELAAIQHENKYLTELLNQRQREFNDEYQRSLQERHYLAQRLEEAQGRSGRGTPTGSFYPEDGAKGAVPPVSSRHKEEYYRAGSPDDDDREYESRRAAGGRRHKRRGHKDERE